MLYTSVNVKNLSFPSDSSKRNNASYSGWLECRLRASHKLEADWSMIIKSSLLAWNPVLRQSVICCHSNNLPASSGTREDKIFIVCNRQRLKWYNAIYNSQIYNNKHEGYKLRTLKLHGKAVCTTITSITIASASGSWWRGCVGRKTIWLWKTLTDGNK